MTRLEEIDYQINHLLSQYQKRKNDPSYKIQLVMLMAERKNLTDNGNVINSLDK